MYRAVIVFHNVKFVGPEASLPVNLFTKEISEELNRLTKIAQAERWRNMETRLLIRSVCPIGRAEWKYEGDQLDYFYPINRTKEQVLQSILNQNEGT